MTTAPRPEDCHCLAVRQAGRAITQLYDQHLASTGLRSTQYAILSRLDRLGAMTINTLAAQLGMDRTTMGRNILPLERDGLIAIGSTGEDRRSKALELTRDGRTRLRAARVQWARAQTAFEKSFGAGRAAQLRDLLRSVAVAEILPARQGAGRDQD